MNDRKGSNKSEGTGSVKNLKKGSVLRVSGNRAGRCIRCLLGMVWVTQQGDNRDRFLNGGEMYLSNLPRIVLIQALTDAKINICLERKERLMGRFPKISRRALSHA